MNPSGETPDWLRAMKADIGENPARFLDRPLPENPHQVPSEHGLGRMMQDRIDGIDRIEVINAWRACERQLQRGRDIEALPDAVDPDDVDFYEHDIEPGRRRVLRALEDRREYLETHGERPRDLLAQHRHELPERYRPHDRDLPAATVEWVERDESGEVVERRPWSERPTGVSKGRRFEAATQAVADGGDSS
ncbi:hypothetical protein [Halorussus salinus]|uniref:hypothetical protein n=1 Tax=Halorussus salinus TaxID=1364935 RepID=UPI001092EF21|nr:hypothetical protein [Halorussus salinus]